MFKIKEQPKQKETKEDTRQLKCACHNGGKVLHYYQREGQHGSVYVCSCCGQEKTA